MLSELKKLTEIMKPPKSPFNVLGDWSQVEAGIGTALPEDYKQFISLYGSGAIGRMPAWILNGLASSMVDHCTGITAAYGDLFADSPQMLPYPMYPQKGGLLPFGATGNGDYLHWLTNGPPNDWRIVVLDFGDITFASFESNLVTFISRLISREYELFPSVFFDPPVEFTPTEMQFAGP